METKATKKKATEPVIWWKDKLAAQDIQISELKRQLDSFARNAEFGDKIGFPDYAVRLVLNEKARWENVPGYSRLANTCFGDDDTFWTAGRIEDRTDIDGKFHPALILLTVERNYMAVRNAREELRQLNSKMADYVMKGRGITENLKHCHAQDVDKLKKEQAVLIALTKDCMEKTEACHKVIETGSQETWYFPMSYKGDLHLATVSICL